MGIVLKVTPEELIKMAGDIESQLKNMQTQFREIQSEINKTHSFWEGDACDVHKSQYDAAVPTIQEAMEGLLKRPGELLKMAGIYVNTEDEAQETAMTLSEDVIV